MAAATLVQVGIMEAALAEEGWRGVDGPEREEEVEWTRFGMRMGGDQGGGERR